MENLKEAGHPEGPPDLEDVRSQYGHFIDIYKFYVEWVLKIGAFNSTVTGALLAFVLGQTDRSVVRYSLLVPVLFSIAVLVMFFMFNKSIDVLRQQIKTLGWKLKLTTVPDLTPLKALCIFFGIFHVILILGLLIFVYDPGIAHIATK